MRILLLFGVVFLVACLGFVAFGRVGPNFIISAQQQQNVDSAAEVRSNIQKLASSNPVDRAEAACRLGQLRAVEAIPALVSLLSDETPIQQTRMWRKE